MRVCIVSPFPKKGYSSVDFSALGFYTKKLVDMLSLNNDYIVLSQSTIKPYTYKGVKVIPTWKRNSLSFVKSIFLMLKNQKPDVVLLQHEVYVFGANQYIYPYLTIVLLFLARLLKIKVVVNMHGVLPLSMFSSDFIKNTGVINLSFLVKLGSLILYFFTCLFANKVIVHNKKLKNYLVSDYKVDVKKISIIPHPLYGFEKPQVVSKTFKKLTKGKKYIFLYFGFLSMYKSLDLLIQAFLKMGKSNSNYCLLIAGGVPKRFAKDRKYLSYISSLKDISKLNKNIIWDTRYINENEIKYYFTNSDCLILPYSYLISASGPLTFAINAKLPVLASSSFTGVLPKSLLFGKSSNDLSKSVKKFVVSIKYRSSLKKIITDQKQEWSDNTIRTLYTNFFNSL